MTKTHSGKASVTLPTDTQILIVREFAAPRHLVYRAWTNADLVKKWWGGLRGEMQVVDIDLRVGGKWRYVMRAHGGFEVAFHGEYRELVPSERIVTTEIYEGAPEPPEPPLNIITFREPSPGHTRLELLVLCPNPELRDIIANSGMEAGLQEQMDLLEQLAVSL